MARTLYAILLLLVSIAPLSMFAQRVPSNRPGIPRFVLHVKKYNDRVYLYMDEVARLYGMTVAHKDKTWTYASKLNKIVLTEDSRTANVNGVNVILSFAPLIPKDTPALFISQVDFKTVLDPIIRPGTLPKKAIKRIVIDAGHGGKDPGCKGGIFEERAINLAVATKLANTLIKHGYVVGMTRMNDTYLPLSQRVKLSDGFKPDLFISLHCNSASATASGIEVFCATPAGAPPSDSSKVSPKPCNTNANDVTNAFIAYYTQKQLVSYLKCTDRGVKHKRFTVIADGKAPAILIEMGFLSNVTDRKYLSSPIKQQIIANAIVSAVNKLRDVSKPKKKP